MGKPDNMEVEDVALADVALGSCNDDARSDASWSRCRPCSSFIYVKAIGQLRSKARSLCVCVVWLCVPGVPPGVGVGVVRGTLSCVHVS